MGREARLIARPLRRGITKQGDGEVYQLRDGQLERQLVLSSLRLKQCRAKG